MVKQIFSTPIYTSDFIRDFNEDEIKSYKKIYDEHSKNELNLIGKSSRVLDETEAFSEIKEFIQVHLNQYTHQVYGMNIKQKIKITTSWLNLSKPGMAHHHHTHPNSFVSGVFYFQTIPKDSIRFTSPITAFSNINFGRLANGNHYDTLNEPVHNGRLIIFPSWLRHEVLTNRSDEDRISLAFNTYPSGNFITKGDISNLEIETK